MGTIVIEKGGNVNGIFFFFEFLKYTLLKDLIRTAAQDHVQTKFATYTNGQTGSHTFGYGLTDPCVNLKCQSIYALYSLTGLGKVI